MRVLALALLLAACGTPEHDSMAGMDHHAGMNMSDHRITVNQLEMTAATVARSSSMCIKAGMVKDPAALRALGQDTYAKIRQVREAFDAERWDDYAARTAEAQAGLRSMNAMCGGV